MSKLYIGWSEVNITPDKKISLAGQFAERISEYVEKPLTATAMAVEAGGEQMILVTTDLVAVGGNLMDSIREKYRMPDKCLSGEAFSRLLSYSWPGNIRELENVLESAVALSESDIIYAEHIRLESEPVQLTLKERLKAEEKRIIQQTLARCGGNRTAAMEQLGLSKTVFYGKLKEYQIS